jgi:hypothetical protein
MKEKSSNTIDNVKDTKVGDSKQFVISVLKNIIYTILWGLVGANLIFLMYSDLDTWFPTDDKKAPYIQFKNSASMFDLRKMWQEYFDKYKKAFSCETSKDEKDSSSISNGTKDVTEFTCSNAEKMIKESKNNNKAIREMLGYDKVSFPYTWNNEGRFKAFFGKSAQVSYITNRKILKDRFKNLYSFSNSFGAGESLLFSIALPLLILTFMLYIPLIMGFLTTSWGEITEGGILMLILGIFCGNITFIYPVIIGVIQTFQLLFKMTILPSLINGKAVWRIMKCKLPILILIFSGLTIQSAFTHLETTMSIIVTSVLLLISFVFIYRLKDNLLKNIE